MKRITRPICRTLTSCSRLKFCTTFLLTSRFAFFFFNDPATTEFSPLSLPDPFPIFLPPGPCPRARGGFASTVQLPLRAGHAPYFIIVIDFPGPLWVFLPLPILWLFLNPRRLSRGDRKSTRLNSSHLVISYAGFCL